MKQIFQINSELNIPIYRQLVDSIKNAIKNGRMQPEQKLPTVQELSDQLGIARGTIKRVYDELELQGLVKKVQGRGTFVCYRPIPAQSRKEKAMAAIDQLLDELGEMGFSPAETKIYLNLKLRERAERGAKLKVAVLECNPENLSRMAEQLRSMAQVDVHSYLTETIEPYPYKLVEGIDLIVTTLSHAEFVESLLPERKRLVKVALRLNPECLTQIAKLPPKSQVGILCSSLRFGEMLRTTAQTYVEEHFYLAPRSVTFHPELKDYLDRCDGLLLPHGYEKYCSEEQLQALQGYEGTIIRCGYEMDEGSFLYLQERVKRLIDAKAL